MLWPALAAVAVLVTVTRAESARQDTVGAPESQPSGSAAIAADALGGRARVVERLLLGSSSTPVTLAVDALGAQVQVHAGAAAADFASSLARGKSAICPRAELRQGTLVLWCRSRQIDASLSMLRGRWHLTLSELAGLPWRPGEGGPPLVAHPPGALGLGGPCPGDTPAGRGECALAAGALAEAERHFRSALEAGPSRAAELRLGDLALVAGDVSVAVVRYRRAGTTGVVGRLAAARLCELGGECFDPPSRRRVFDPTGLPPGPRAEMELRAARVEAFLGRPALLAPALRVAAETLGGPGPCGGAERLCMRLLLEALQAEPVESRVEALVLYLSPRWRASTWLREKLARAAAEAATSLGAPVFGANLLAANARGADGVLLGNNLLRAAELYLEAGEQARAAVIYEYANLHLERSELRSERWRKVANGLKPQRQPRARSAPVLDEDGAARDVKEALALLSRVRSKGAAP